MKPRDPTITLIAALSRNRVIGREGALPWRLADDLEHFKRTTAGRCVVMGRKTFDTMGKPLPNRTNIVITRRKDFDVDGVIAAPSLDEAIARAGDQTEVFIAGGEQIYRLALPRADRMILTLIDAEVEGDTFFPEFDEQQWRIVQQVEHAADARNEYPFTIRWYERRAAPHPHETAGATAGDGNV